MATVPMIDDDNASDEVKAVYDDIRRVRGTDFINNFWRALANDPAALRATWEEIKDTMAPGALDPLVKELIYVAVSSANSCSYCVHSHTAAARAKGMTNEMYAELVRVIALAGKTNHMVTAMQVPVDKEFTV